MQLAKGGNTVPLYLWLKNLLDGEEGQDLVEYALLVGLIVIIAVVAVTSAGQSIQTIFQNIAGQLNAVSS
jgi:Flp pilus assembly pilin Flp